MKTEVGLSPRIARLKSTLIPKSFRSTISWHPELGEREDITSAYRPGIKLCLESARLYTESCKATEGQPTIIRRAKALANVLQNMTVWIQPDELIVGNYASTPTSLTWHPEYSWRWLVKAVTDGYRNLLDDEGRQRLGEIAAYWKGKPVQGAERDYLPPDVLPYWFYNGATLFTHQTESGVPDYETIFRVGLQGYIEKAQAALEALKKDATVPAPEYVEKKDFLEAVLISLNAAVKWSKRYAELARSMAETEPDSNRKAELLKIAEACEWALESPPRTLHEALQTFYFLHLITHIIEAYENGISSRVDQLFNPFFERDFAAGDISRDEAKELFECLWLKCNEIGFLFAPVAGGGAAQGSSLQQTMTLGGVTKEGKDAVNEVTHIILDSRDELAGLTEPTTAVRVHGGTSQEFLMRVTDSIRRRAGTVSLFNDEVIVSRLLKAGIPLEDARDFGIEQCMRWTIPGKNIVYRSIDGRIIAPKCLELALSQGVDKFSGKQIGAATPDPNAFNCVEDVTDAFFEQVRFFAEKLGKIVNTVDVLYQEHLPRPFLSAVLDGGIEAGKDCRKWYYYPKRSMGYVGPINVANALAAIKKLVFEENRLSITELTDALNANWEGRDDLRRMFINEAPKFGNDEDYVDAIAREVQVRAEEVVESVKNCYGAPYTICGSSVASYFAYSSLCGATADGRGDKDLFTDGTVSPALGTDKNGPTAILKSASKCDPVASYNHLLNMKFLPAFLEGPNKEAFVAYLRTWHDLGVHHIQFNIIDKETLIEAQRDPKQYDDLTVRVAGYSAYFVDLAKGIQDQIIERTEYGCGV
ncbi:MAG: hypothetical protein HYX92_22335 [Chloroflexi bacterium]|nr:hypothetical protein [Chloroflexota bacterium]